MIAPYKLADVSFNWIRDLDEQGCFSRVYLAHDNNLDHDLVIKEIPKDPSSTPEEYFAEARLVYKYNHPNIVQIQYAAQCDKNVYIAMPLYNKGSLNKLMESNNLTAREIIRFSIQFLNGLHHIHTNGLMHFDIKPNNILLSDRNEAMLSDFGLSKLVGATGKAEPKNGYYFHMPPEYFNLAKGVGFNYTFDLYQVGLTIYRMCVGFDRFEEERLKFRTLGELSDAITSGSFPEKNYPSNIPRRLISIIDKCIKINPNERYQSALDILNDLSIISEGALDWREVKQPKGSPLIEWIKETEDATLSVVYDQASKALSGKRTNSSGKVRKEAKLTLEKCTSAKIYSLLKDN